MCVHYCDTHSHDGLGGITCLRFGLPSIRHIDDITLASRCNTLQGRSLDRSSSQLLPTSVLVCRDEEAVHQSSYCCLTRWDPGYFNLFFVVSFRWSQLTEQVIQIRLSISRSSSILTVCMYICKICTCMYSGISMYTWI